MQIRKKTLVWYLIIYLFCIKQLFWMFGSISNWTNIFFKKWWFANITTFLQNILIKDNIEYSIGCKGHNHKVSRPYAFIGLVLAIVRTHIVTDGIIASKCSSVEHEHTLVIIIVNMTNGIAVDEIERRWYPVVLV